jgi:hypothetical protein
VEREEDTVNIDMSNIFDHDPDLYAKIVQYPLDIIPLLDTECPSTSGLTLRNVLRFASALDSR